MARTVIFTDSTVDLPDDIIVANDIRVVPQYVTLDGDSLQDGISVKPGDIYEYVKRTGKTPKTATTTSVDFAAAFSPVIAEGDEIVFIGISEKLSATVHQAQLAAIECAGHDGGTDSVIRVLDGRSLSTGTALSVLKACEYARNGMSADEISSELAAYTPRVRASFVLDSLQFLYYGGRCSALQSIGASLLKIKPRIEVIGGEMRPGEKYRGSLVHVARQFAQNILKGTDKIDPDRVFITYSEGTDQAVISAVRDEVYCANCFREVIETVAGCVITCHCGRNAIGLLYAEKG